MEVNLKGPLLFMRGVLPSMLHRQTGTIVTITSTSGSLDIPYNTAYATSKSSVIKFTQDLWHEVHDKGVRCYTLHPGSVQTSLAESEGAVNMEIVQSHPGMQRVFGEFQKITYQTPELAANTCVALCVEEDAGLMNGRYIDSQQDLGDRALDANGHPLEIDRAVDRPQRDRAPQPSEYQRAERVGIDHRLDLSRLLAGPDPPGEPGGPIPRQLRNALA